MAITREQLGSLSLASLRETASSLGLKGVSKVRKNELIDILLAEQKRQEEAAAPTPGPKDGETPAKAPRRTAARRKKTAAPAEPVVSEKEKPQAASEKEKPEIVSEKGRPEAEVAAKEPREEKTAGESSGKGRHPARTQTRSGAKRQPRDAAASRKSAKRSDKTAAERSTEPRQERQTEKAERPEKDAEIRALSEKAVTESETSERVVTEKPKDLYGDAEEVRDEHALGILEIMQEGYGFIRSENYLPGENDVYVSQTLIHRFHLRTGDVLTGVRKYNKPGDKFMALSFLSTVNGRSPMELMRRPVFEKLTPIFPDKRIRLENEESPLAMRMVDLISPIGKGQRGMIVAQPKAGKTTLLKQIARSVVANEPSMHVIILLIDERPEEVTDMKETVLGDNVEVIYSTFDELPEHHKRVAEMTIERAKRLVEQNEDVIILLDSITRLARAYNLTVTPSGKTLSGGLDPTALYGPKRFFGAARNTREGGSLTILASALVETGSKMDDVVFEEFKGTGNMELVLDRKLSEKRVFPAIDLAKSSTRREDLLLTPDEEIAVSKLRRALNGVRPEEAAERIIDLFYKTRSNDTLVKLLLQRNYI
ncbi:MAG: transcription termination factor Rho [Lachnospiraceae bacterium]|jgi:transcription termination factor Rho|nr:transcription termination factor Rho [Lachnospiraceae bacterium]MCH4030693.1 transcription termination factor Rho [Lachnospiraceae bacterium]MCH4070665.1 transcription termination factor Rho [Lachnospiraceae bacterium]MCH4107159.1 transcription termination factor Rho [Lachnospiraceae bacterium]MCI1301986.1 transcription termination factor Rho [Lachnospiraceae bacterium]